MHCEKYSIMGSPVTFYIYLYQSSSSENENLNLLLPVCASVQDGKMRSVKTPTTITLKPKQYFFYLAFLFDGAHVYMSLLSTMEVKFNGLLVLHIVL